MDTVELIDLQINLEYRAVQGNRLFPFPHSTEQARFISYCYSGGLQRFFRHDLPEEILVALTQVDPFRNPDQVRRILDRLQPCPAGGVFESYSFQHRPLPSEYPLAAWDGKVFTISSGAGQVCWAWSERHNERCAEVAVETDPGFRRHGFARQAVCALAAQEMDAGRVVFFSHRVDNLASAALARSLGVVHFAACTAFA